MRKMHEILMLVCGFLNDRNMEYVLIGGIVVSIHGIPRSTIDMDIIISLDGKALEDLIYFLKHNGFAVGLEDAQAAFLERSHFTADDTRSQLRLDIKGIYNEMDRRTMARRVSFNFKGVDLMVETPEDLIAAKLFYGSEQDIRDAEGVYLSHNGRLDMKYLKASCQSYGITKELAAMVRRVQMRAK